MDRKGSTTFDVIQLGAPRGPNGSQLNEAVTNFESLTTHHPGDNRHAHLEGGLVVDGQPGRLHAIIGGEIQEVEIARGGNDFHGLKPDQVLLKKDFILENPNSINRRLVEVPSPVAGVVGRVSAAEGLVDIHDRSGGDLIARVRHMRSITLQVDDEVSYGMGLGVQGNVQTGGAHVHVEMDTRYHRQFENYLADLVQGRLPVEADARQNVQPRPVLDDGTFRLGESSPRVRDLQDHLNGMNYVGADNKPLVVDGVYRLNMQRAVLDFQRDQCLAQTGDISPELLRMLPARAPGPFDPAIEGLRTNDLPDAPMPYPLGAGQGDRPCGPPSEQQIQDAQERRRPLEPVFSSAPGASPASSDPLIPALRDKLSVAFAQHGAVPPATDLDRIAACLAVECRRGGIEHPDHVAVGRPAPDGSGRHVFAVEGEMNDPAHRRVGVPGQAAAQTPLEDSLTKLAALPSQSSIAVAPTDQAQEVHKGMGPRV